MTLSNNNLEIILGALGNADIDQLGDINQECIRQLKLARSQKANEIGRQLVANETRVRYTNSGIRPQYLQGQTGLVVKIADSRAHVKLDRGPQGKFRSGIVVSPLSSLEVI